MIDCDEFDDEVNLRRFMTAGIRLEWRIYVEDCTIGFTKIRWYEESGVEGMERNRLF